MPPTLHVRHWLELCSAWTPSQAQVTHLLSLCTTLVDTPFSSDVKAFFLYIKSQPLSFIIVLCPCGHCDLTNNINLTHTQFLVRTVVSGLVGVGDWWFDQPALVTMMIVTCAGCAGLLMQRRLSAQRAQRKLHSTPLIRTTAAKTHKYSAYTPVTLCRLREFMLL